MASRHPMRRSGWISTTLTGWTRLFEARPNHQTGEISISYNRDQEITESTRFSLKQASSLVLGILANEIARSHTFGTSYTKRGAVVFQVDLRTNHTASAVQELHTPLALRCVSVMASRGRTLEAVGEVFFMRGLVSTPYKLAPHRHVMKKPGI